MLPDCGESFNVVTGEGLRDVPGWRLLKYVVPGYLCPAHAPLVTDGSHMPHWLTTGELPEPGLRGIGCACGWKWQPAVPVNAGGHHARWHAHLAALAASPEFPAQPTHSRS
jgi:hypothetical protein